MNRFSVTRKGNTKPTRVARFQQVKRAVSRALFTLCWLPTAALAVIYWVQGKTSAPALLFVMLLTWYLVEYNVPRRYSDYFSIVLAIVMLYAPAWEPNPNARLWYAVTLAGAAAEVLAALYSPWPYTFIFILIAAWIEHLVLVSRTYFMFNTGAHGLNNWIGPLWLVLLGSFVAFASHRLSLTFAQEDRIADSLEALRAREAIAKALTDEHASQQRRLHETVLNTLASIVRKDSGSTAPLLNRLRDEISQARVYQGLETPTSMNAIVGSVLPPPGENDPRIEIADDADVLLSPPVARDVRDALAELIRNAIKHSAGSRVDISWQVSGSNLLIRVADDGVGLSGKTSKGLGLGRILPEILRDRDGEMSITSNNGSGTRIELTIPMEPEPTAPIESEGPRSVLEEFDSVGRLLLAAPALSVAALGWWLIGPFELKPLLAALLVIHVVSILVASLNPRARGAWILICVGLLVGMAIITLMSLDSKSCVDTAQLRWAANFLYDSASLALAFYAPRKLRTPFIILTASGLFVLSFFVAPNCAKTLLTPAIALLGLILVVLTLWGQATRWTITVQLGERRSAEMTRRRVERRLSVYRANQWSSALDSLENFANAATDGSFSDREVQERAHIEEERLRARIQLDPFVNGSFAQLALDLVNDAAEHGWTPTITVVETYLNSQVIPDGVHRAISDACAKIDNGQCQITLYLDEDEECMTIVSSALDVERAATQINLTETSATRPPAVKSIRAIFDSSEGEKWLEIRRSL